LVSLAVFSIVILISGTALIGLARASDKSHAILTAINNLDFALEQMTRTLRVSKKFYCATGVHPLSDETRDCPWGRSASSLSFTDSSERRVNYAFNQSRGSLDRKVIEGGLPTVFSITSPEIFIENLSFNLTGSSRDDSMQPRILIRVQARTVIPEVKESDQVSFKLQTTVSARNIDL
jgi:hypothetical protein